MTKKHKFSKPDSDSLQEDSGVTDPEDSFRLDEDGEIASNEDPFETPPPYTPPEPGEGP